MASASLTSRTIIGASWMIAWRMVTRALGMISTLVLARILLPSDFGLIAMATAFASAVDALSQLGLQDVLVRRRGDGQALFNVAFTLQVCRGVLTAAILAGGAPAAVWWFGEPRLMPVMLVLAGGALISGAENIAIAEIRRNMDYGRQFRLLTIPRLLQVAVTIPTAIATHSYWALLAGIIISKLARTLMTFQVHPYRPRFSTQGWREVAGFSLWTWAAAAVGMVWDRCDPFILGPALGPSQLGVYLLALEMATLPVTEFILPSADALFTAFAAAQQKGESSTPMAPAVAVTLFMAALPLIIGTSATSGYLVAALLGPKWIEAQPLISIMAFSGAFSAFSMVSGAVLVANSYIRRNFVINLTTSAVKLAVMASLVHLTSDIELIALGTTICVAFESFVYIFLLSGTGQVRLSDMYGGLVRGVGAGAATLMAIYETGLGWQKVTLSPLPALAQGMAVGCLTIAIFALVAASLWLLSGRPAGPESRIVSLLTSGLEKLQPIFSSFRRIENDRT